MLSIEGIIADKPFKLCYDNNIRNIIIASVFKYLYEESINKANNSEIPPLPFLCRQINISDLGKALNILSENSYDLICVKNLYVSDTSIYIYYNKYINKIFTINLKISSNKIIALTESNKNL